MYDAGPHRHCEENKAFRGDEGGREGREGRVGDYIRWSGKVLFDEVCLTKDLNGVKLLAKQMEKSVSIREKKALRPQLVWHILETRRPER